MCPNENIVPIVNRLADPTDRPFNPSSSPDDGGAVKNAHGAAALKNETDEKLENSTRRCIIASFPVTAYNSHGRHRSVSRRRRENIFFEMQGPH